MSCMITLGAAQTGPVNEDDWRPNVAAACAMIEEAGRRKVFIVSITIMMMMPPTIAPTVPPMMPIRWPSWVC